MSTLLEVKDITKIYPNQPKPGLDHVSFEVMQGVNFSVLWELPAPVKQRF